MLSEKCLLYFKKHIQMYQPQYGLFEGEFGGQYDARSIQNIFRKAIEKVV